MTGTAGRSTWIALAGLLCACDGAATSSAPESHAALERPVERATLHGRVTRTDGTPLAGAVVRAAPVPVFPGVPDERKPVESTASADGAFDLPGVVAGDWAVSCSADGAWRGPQGVVRLPDVRRFDVVLPTGPVFEGSLVDDATGKALPGVKVQALRAGGVVAEVVTGADGRFEFDLHAAYAAVDEVRLDAPGYGAHPGGFAVGCVVDGSSAGDRVPLALRARRGIVVCGTVTGPAGPVAGAEVEAWFAQSAPGESGAASATRRATTRSDGAYEIVGIEGSDCVIRVTAPGLVQAEVLAEGVRDPRAWPRLAPDACRVALPESDNSAETTRHDVKLVAQTPSPRRAVRGRVHDAAGAPLAGAKVIAGFTFDSADATTGADGTFTVQAPVLGDVTWVAVGREGSAVRTSSVDVSSEDADKPLDVELSPDPVARGRVTDERGAPIAGARVNVVPRPEADDTGAVDEAPRFPPGPPPSAACDAEGRFSLRYRRTSEGDFLVATAPGFAPRRDDVASDATTETSIVLPKACELTGRVVRGDTGAPAAGVRVAQIVDENAGDDDLVRAGRVVAVTSADGSFRVTGIGSGACPLCVFAHGWLTRRVSVEVPLVAAVRVEIEPSLTLAGRLLFEDGSPAADVEVAAYDRPRDADGSWSAQVSRSVRSRADGRFAIPGLRPVPHWVGVQWGEPRVIAESIGPFSPDADVERPMRVARGASIVGRLVDLQGRPFVVEEGGDEPVVRATPAGGADRPDGRGRAEPGEPTGAFSVGGLDHGAYDVAVRARGFVPVKLKNVRADAGPLVVKMDPGLSLSGVVLGADGRPLANVTLVATSEDPAAADGDAQRDCDTDDRGAFRIAGLSQGRWRLDLYRGVTVDGMQRLSGNLEFDAGADDLRLTCVAVATKRR